MNSDLTDILRAVVRVGADEIGGRFRLKAEIAALGPLLVGEGATLADAAEQVRAQLRARGLIST